MNFSYKNIIEKRKALASNSQRNRSRALISFLKIFLFAIAFLIIVGGFTALGMVKGILDGAPDMEDVSISPDAYATRIFDASGELVTTLSSDGSNREDASIDEMPDCLQKAFVAIEDERFYEHQGIDLQGILRAAFVTLSGTGFEGASTITQQVIKNNVFESGGFETNMGALIKRKIQEQFLALQIEKVSSKNVILENYLNTINLGSGNYGVVTASSYYFGKNVSELNISESAVLAAIAQNPSYNPVAYPEKNAARRSKVLKHMLDQGYISQTEYTEAIEDDIYSRIQANTADKSNSPIYTYFTDALIDQVLADLEEYGYSPRQASEALYRGGLQIFSTQDTQIQDVCDEELTNEANYPVQIYYSFDWAWTIKIPDGSTKNYSKGHIYKYYREIKGDSNFTLNFLAQEDALACIEDFKTYTLEKENAESFLETDVTFTIQPQISFSVMDQHTGEVKALVGGRGEKTASLTLNRATDTTRQPGSTFKALAAYAPAMDSAGYTLGTVIEDAPYAYADGTYVRNWYGADSYRGFSTVRQGIAQSMNILAVKTTTDIGPSLAYDYLKKFGFTTLTENDIVQALPLGGITTGVKNVELCAAYATIANKGTYTEPILYTKILDRNGKMIIENSPKTETVLKESTAWLLNSALMDVVTRGTGTTTAVPGITTAGKTGTTSKDYDLWFVGYSGHLTACIWTGYDDNMTMRNAGYHKPLWSKIMSRIHAEKGLGNRTIMDRPGNIVTAQVCSISGKLPVEGMCDSDPSGTSTIITEYFEQGTVPTETCDRHTSVTVCSESKLLPNPSCPITTSRIFRVRPEGAEGTTADTPFTIPEGFFDNICTIHEEEPETETPEPSDED